MKLLSLVLLLSLSLGVLSFVPQNQTNSLELTSGTHQNQELQCTNSTNPASPTLLLNDIGSYQTYSGTNDYYYETFSQVTANYYVFWIKPDSGNDQDLYLYNDSGYSTLLAGSVRLGSSLEWVIFRKNISQYLYPLVENFGSGHGYIKYKGGYGFNFVSGSVSAVGSLDSTECIVIYQTYLENTSSYRFSLAEPVGGDFYLYLYYLEPGTACTYNSYMTGGGYLNSIWDYTPTKTGNYVLAVVRNSGSGSYTLYGYQEKQILSDSSHSDPYNESFSSVNNYFYRMEDPFHHYNVFWVQPDYDLYLFTDHYYTDLLISSKRQISPTRPINWVIFTSNSSTALDYYYAVIDPINFKDGAVLWDDCNLGTSVGVGGMGSTENMKTYTVSLSSASNYSITLDNPLSGDYDLYLYYLPNEGDAANTTTYLAASKTSGIGTDESIIFSPPSTGVYLILVVWSSGSGTYDLDIEYYIPGTNDGKIPVFDLTLLFLGFTLVAFFRLRQKMKNLL